LHRFNKARLFYDRPIDGQTDGCTDASTIAKARLA